MPPTQYTRPDEQRRHLLFARPDQRHIGNGPGALGKAWGEVRGENGVIRVVPSAQWTNTGVLPTAPPAVVAALPTCTPGEHAADADEVRAFAQAHDGPGTRPGMLAGAVAVFERDAAEGSRHNAAVDAACMAARIGRRRLLLSRGRSAGATHGLRHRDVPVPQRRSSPRRTLGATGVRGGVGVRGRKSSRT